MNVTSNRGECFFRWWGDDEARAENTRLSVRIGCDGGVVIHGKAGKAVEVGKSAI